MFYLIALSVSEIIWGFWQISKWLWCIGRVILATDSWSTRTDLPQWHSSTTNPRNADLGMKPSRCTERLVADFLPFFIILWFVKFSVFIKNLKSCLRTRKMIRRPNRQLTYLWFNCFLSIAWECVGAIMHYTIIVIRHSEIGDCACVIFIKIVLFPWWRTDKLHCIFTEFTEAHNNTILYRCDCWKFNFLAV
jgi:hypothetical protein